MAWIESHQELGAHPKTRKLARLLGCSLPAAIGHLHCLWWWALDYAQDGDVGRHDAEDVAVACLWDGDPEALMAALRACRFLDNDGQLHDWGDYAGKLVDRRERNRERMRAARAVHDDTRVELPNSTQQYPTVPNSTEPDPTLPLAAQSAAPARGAAAADNAPVPTRSRARNGGPEPMTPEQRESLLDSFAVIPDVGAVLETALAHKARLKCASEYLYARNWLRTELQRYEEHEARLSRATGRPPPQQLFVDSFETRKRRYAD